MIVYHDGSAAMSADPERMLRRGTPPSSTTTSGDSPDIDMSTDPLQPLTSGSIDGCTLDELVQLTDVWQSVQPTGVLPLDRVSLTARAISHGSDDPTVWSGSDLRPGCHTVTGKHAVATIMANLRDASALARPGHWTWAEYSSGDQVYYVTALAQFPGRGCDRP